MTDSKFDLAVKLDNVGKTYVEHHLHALSGINLAVETGEFIVVMGPSGCGKSTLLNLVAGIDTPSEGKISIAGKSLETPFR